MYVKKGKVIFGYKDTFSLDHTLASIIRAALVLFRSTIVEKHHGVPCEIIAELVESGDIEYGKNFGVSDEAFDKAFALWLEKIDEMIFAFTDMSDAVYDHPTSKERVAASLEYNERKQRGLDLFAKHYTSLWW